VIGSGAGANIVDAALQQGMRVALVDRGPVGGICLNSGCIPTKKLIVASDRVVEIQAAEKLGIKAEIQSIDFAAIMEQTRLDIQEARAQIRRGLEAAENPGANVS
jgi:dihydrolipoamide dehydrogenase